MKKTLVIMFLGMTGHGQAGKLSTMTIAADMKATEVKTLVKKNAPKGAMAYMTCHINDKNEQINGILIAMPGHWIISRNSLAISNPNVVEKMKEAGYKKAVVGRNSKARCFYI